MKYLNLIFAFLILTACTPKLEGTRWTLRTLNGHELKPHTVITLEFEKQRIYGRGGCNNYGGDYSLHLKNGFRVSGGAVTQIGCSEGVLEQENEYTTALWSVTNYSIEGNTLSLTNKTEEIALEYQRMLKFNVNAKDLVGKTWQLVSATGMEGMKLDAFTLQFDGNKYSGTTTCRTYEGDYQAIDDSLLFPSLNMIGNINCSNEDLLSEGTYTSLLGIVWQYNVSDKQLELYTDSGQKLVFDGK